MRRLQGCDLLRNAAREGSKLVLEIRWKGPKLTLGSLRRSSVARNFTKEAEFDVDGGGAAVVHWDEEFPTLCNLNGYKDNVFHPWEIAFTLFNVSLSLSLSLSQPFSPYNGICFNNLKIGLSNKRTNKKKRRRLFELVKCCSSFKFGDYY